GAEVAGPGLAGALIKAVGAPIALLVDALLLAISAAILRGITIHERPWQRTGDATAAVQFWTDLKAGVRFVARHRLLVALAMVVGGWQACHQAAMVVQILFATRTLGLSEQAVGLSYTGMGAGTVIASVFGNRISRRFGPGRSLVAGIAITGAGWSLLSIAPVDAWGVAVFTLTLMMFSTGAVLIFINFLALRQAVTPAPLLGRMTSTMRWLILVPAGPGALLGGWLGEHHGLRSSLAVAGGGALLLALAASRLDVIRNIRQLPQPEPADGWIGAEADVRQVEAF
ncbi:MAG: MFS transporter, partial [Pseudomonadota bacterium]|nr:MFS transporter [Pseudomonadota bacterium]